MCCSSRFCLPALPVDQVHQRPMRHGDTLGTTLEFKRPGDRVRVQIPGEFDSLTFSCWVKIDSLDRWYNSLFLTDGHDQHEPHWQIMDDGRLFFSVKKRDRWDTSKGEKDKHIVWVDLVLVRQASSQAFSAIGLVMRLRTANHG